MLMAQLPYYSMVQMVFWYKPRDSAGLGCTRMDFRFGTDGTEAVTWTPQAHSGQKFHARPPRGGASLPSGRFFGVTTRRCWVVGQFENG